MNFWDYFARFKHPYPFGPLSENYQRRIADGVYRRPARKKPSGRKIKKWSWRRNPYRDRQVSLCQMSAERKSPLPTVYPPKKERKDDGSNEVRENILKA